jgi:hypothetical protein
MSRRMCAQSRPRLTYRCRISLAMGSPSSSWATTRGDVDNGVVVIGELSPGRGWEVKQSGPYGDGWTDGEQVLGLASIE